LENAEHFLNENGCIFQLRIPSTEYVEPTLEFCMKIRRKQALTVT